MGAFRRGGPLPFAYSTCEAHRNQDRTRFAPRFIWVGRFSAPVGAATLVPEASHAPACHSVTVFGFVLQANGCPAGENFAPVGSRDVHARTHGDPSSGLIAHEAVLE